jgi:hypothetical protein
MSMHSQAVICRRSFGRASEEFWRATMACCCAKPAAVATGVPGPSPLSGAICRRSQPASQPAARRHRPAGSVSLCWASSSDLSPALIGRERGEVYLTNRQNSATAEAACKQGATAFSIQPALAQWDKPLRVPTRCRQAGPSWSEAARAEGLPRRRRCRKGARGATAGCAKWSPRLN